jgi:hypothetical protein
MRVVLVRLVLYHSPNLASIIFYDSLDQAYTGFFPCYFHSISFTSSGLQSGFYLSCQRLDIPSSTSGPLKEIFEICIICISVVVDSGPSLYFRNKWIHPFIQNLYIIRWS